MHRKYLVCVHKDNTIFQGYIQYTMPVMVEHLFPHNIADDRRVSCKLKHTSSGFCNTARVETNLHIKHSKLVTANTWSLIIFIVHNNQLLIILQNFLNLCIGR